MEQSFYSQKSSPLHLTEQMAKHHSREAKEREMLFLQKEKKWLIQAAALLQHQWKLKAALQGHTFGKESAQAIAIHLKNFDAQAGRMGFQLRDLPPLTPWDENTADLFEAVTSTPSEGVQQVLVAKTIEPAVLQGGEILLKGAVSLWMPEGKDTAKTQESSGEEETGWRDLANFNQL